MTFSQSWRKSAPRLRASCSWGSRSVAIETFSRNFPEDDQSDVLGTKPLRILREILNAASTLLPVAAGATLIAGWRGALYLLIPAIVACVYMSIGYAWVFAVEIPRRREVKKKGEE